MKCKKVGRHCDGVGIYRHPRSAHPKPNELLHRPLSMSTGFKSNKHGFGRDRLVSIAKTARWSQYCDRFVVSQPSCSSGCYYWLICPYELKPTAFNIGWFCCSYVCSPVFITWGVLNNCSADYSPSHSN
jgi:hypothetical protein